MADVAQAARVVKAARLAQVRLAEGTMESDIWTPDEMGDDPDVTMGYESTAPVFKPDEREWFTARATMRVAVQEDVDQRGDDAEPNGVLIECTYELLYRLEEGFKASDDEFLAFSRTNVVFNAWPFFREFIHSAMTRMGLPPLTIPLFRIPKADTQEETESVQA